MDVPHGCNARADPLFSFEIPRRYSANVVSFGETMRWDIEVEPFHSTGNAIDLSVFLWNTGNRDRIIHHGNESAVLTFAQNESFNSFAPLLFLNQLSHSIYWSCFIDVTGASSSQYLQIQSRELYGKWIMNRNIRLLPDNLKTWHLSVSSLR